MSLDFLVMRKGLDPTAETALHALRDLMGKPVRDVQHGRLWRFDLEEAAPGAALKAEIARAACRAGRYVNLNRDTFFWLDEPQPGRSGETCGVDLCIYDGNGQDDVARAYFQSQIQRRLRRVRRGTWYCLWLPLAEPQRARRHAEELARTCSRQQGLLMNPHSQSLDVLGVRPGTEGKA